MFCPSCDKIVPVGTYSYQDLDCEVVLKANRLIATGKAMELGGAAVELDTTSKVDINKQLSDVIINDNMDEEVVCPDCREGVLFTSEDIDEPEIKETKEDKLRRATFAPETPGALGALTPEFIRKQIQGLDSQIKEEKALTKDSITTRFNIARYYISLDKGSTWKEVSLSSYATAERHAGFVPDAMKGPIASQSFDFEGVMGKVVQPKEIK